MEVTASRELPGSEVTRGSGSRVAGKRRNAVAWVDAGAEERGGFRIERVWMSRITESAGSPYLRVGGFVSCRSSADREACGQPASSAGERGRSRHRAHSELPTIEPTPSRR
jgi:hypothetical protein